MTIDRNVLTKLKQKDLKLEEFFILYSKVMSLGWTSIYRPSIDTYESLRKKEYLNGNNQVTNLGTLTISYITNINMGYEEEKEQQFEEWWKLFPSTDKDDGRVPPYRSLRNRLTDCKNLYYQYLIAGINHDEIISGLNKEIEARKRASEFKYMKNSYRWLKEKTWKVYAETESDNTTDVDIL